MQSDNGELLFVSMKIGVVCFFVFFVACSSKPKPPDTGIDAAFDISLDHKLPKDVSIPDSTVIIDIPVPKDIAVNDVKIFDSIFDSQSKSDGSIFCQPSQVYCNGSEVRQCNSSGQGSILLGDCKMNNTPPVTYACQLCQPSGFACRSSHVLLIGNATGTINFLYQYQPGCNMTIAAKAAFAPSGLTFNHEAYKVSNPPYIYFDINDLSKVPSGTAVPLYYTPQVGQTFPISLSIYKSSGQICTNNYSTTTQPPSNGTVTFTYSGLSKGSQIKIEISGYLSCDSGQTWDQFDYKVSGMTF